MSIPPDDRGPDWPQRPQNQLFDLPIQYRWELTRRHPTYLIAWKPALLHFHQQEFEDPRVAELCFVASVLLKGICVGGKPIDPATPADELLEGLGPEWLGGPVMPLSIRAIALELFMLLPAAERLAIGEAFVRSASPEHAITSDDPNGVCQAVLALEELGSLPYPALDQYFPDKPLFYVHMDVSQRAILDDMTAHIQRHHARLNRKDQRTRTGAIEDALAVWDRREGWTGAGYETTSEKTFKKIAAELLIPLTTAVSRYKAAFEWVTGIEFSAFLWFRLMGPLKLGLGPKAALGSHGAAAFKRLAGRTRRPTPESTLQNRQSSEAARPGVASSLAVDDSEIELRDLILDLEALVASGASDEKISQELELSRPQLSEVRARLAELRSL